MKYEKTIGFYCPFIHNNQEHQRLADLLNDLSDDFTTVLFNSSYGIINNNIVKYAILHCNQAKYFYGKLFLFDIDSVSIANTFPGPSKKIFIASDIFWENKSMPASVLSNLVSDDIDILTYDKTTYDLYDICLKTPIHNFENGLNNESIKKVIYEQL
jgi:hypothetical protein